MSPERTQWTYLHKDKKCTSERSTDIFVKLSGYDFCRQGVTVGDASYSAHWNQQEVHNSRRAEADAAFKCQGKAEVSEYLNPQKLVEWLAKRLCCFKRQYRCTVDDDGTFNYGPKKNTVKVWKLEG